MPTIVPAPGSTNACDVFIGYCTDDVLSEVLDILFTQLPDAETRDIYN